MKVPFDLHKRAGAWFLSIGGAHQVYPLAKEHIFLAVHEYVSHQGWLVYTIGGVALLVGAPFAAWAFKRKKGETGNV